MVIISTRLEEYMGGGMWKMRDATHEGGDPCQAKGEVTGTLLGEE